MRASILGISSYLPDRVITNADLAKDFPDWSIERIGSKTGIAQRHIARSDESALTMAREAATNLFSSGVCSPDDVDFVLLCTQSSEYVLPTTACLLQQLLGISKDAGALDFNLGCSGYIYGLGIAQGLIETGQASKLLFLTSETYSKYLDPADRSSVTIFGDGAAATLIGAEADDRLGVRPAYVYGTDGTGASHLMVKHGGTLRMDGPEIFRFTLQVIPDCIRKLLCRTQKRMEDIDLFVFHQANRYMLDHLRTKLGIPEEKFYLYLENCGNTVSSTIPIALESALAEGRVKPGSQVMLVGFGVGLSWGATLLSWPVLGC